MRQNGIGALIEKLLPISRATGDAVIAVYEAGDANVQRKEDSTPATEAYLAAHLALVAHLARLLPNCPVVSEEDDGSQTHRLDKGRFWLIDPLDGTKEFIARNVEFTVNIVLIENRRSLLGWCGMANRMCSTRRLSLPAMSR